jgi:hypothetical protein
MMKVMKSPRRRRSAFFDKKVSLQFFKRISTCTLIFYFFEYLLQIYLNIYIYFKIDKICAYYFYNSVNNELFLNLQLKFSIFIEYLGWIYLWRKRYNRVNGWAETGFSFKQGEYANWNVGSWRWRQLSCEFDYFYCCCCYYYNCYYSTTSTINTL